MTKALEEEEEEESGHYLGQRVLVRRVGGSQV